MTAEVLTSALNNSRTKSSPAESGDQDGAQVYEPGSSLDHGLSMQSCPCHCTFCAGRLPCCGSAKTTLEVGQDYLLPF